MPSISLPTAVLGAGALGLAGAGISANAANTAAQEQAQASRNALSTQVAAENTALASESPFLTIGTGAADQLANLYGIAYGPSGSASTTTGPTGIVTPGNVNATASSPGGQAIENAAMANFTNTPDYKFAFQQGLQALDRSAAAGTTPGLSQGGGGAVMGAEQYGQGLASQQFGNYFNRLLSLSNLGQSAAAGVSNTALSGANSQGNTQQAIGESLASGAVGSASAINSGLSGIGSNLLSSQLINKLGIGGTNVASAYNNSTGNYLGLSGAQQDSLQDADLLPGTTLSDL
jgi:hypothetical protein